MFEDFDHLKYHLLLFLKSALRPYMIDPSSRATEWLKVHMKDARLEVVNQQVNYSSSNLCP